MPVDTTTLRSRRALLGAGLGALAATVAGALGRATPAEADDGGSVLLGQINTAVHSTSIEASGDNAIFALGTDHSGVVGRSTSADGVAGESTSGTGVAGFSVKGAGVVGVSTKGPGGVFYGKTAQLQLAPSSATNHPLRGARGELFVDKSGRLWFCKGGTSWKQLA